MPGIIRRGCDNDARCLQASPGASQSYERVICRPSTEPTGEQSGTRSRPTPAGSETEEYLTAEQVERIAEAAGRDGRLVVLVLAYCGLRWCEMAAPRVSSIDFLRRRLNITEAMTEVHGRLVWGVPKTYEARSVPIPRILIDDLSNSVAGKRPNELVFTTVSGRSTTKPQCTPRLVGRRGRRYRGGGVNSARAAAHRGVASRQRGRECEGRSSHARTRLRGHDAGHLCRPIR